MGMPNTETFGEFKSRYRGMNPDFVRNVWEKRREEKAAAQVDEIIESEPKLAELGRIQLDKWAQRRVAGLKRRAEEGGARAIIARIALKHGFSFEQIIGRRRHKALIVARHEAIMEVAEQNPTWSLPRIGRIFDRDHTTILHVLNKASRANTERTDG